MAKRSLRSLCFLVLGTASLLSGAPLQAATYYVSPSGNDGNAGTSTSAPWKTIGKANARLLPGDTVLVMPGTYAETIDPASSGTPAAPISYKAYNAGNKPKIVGRGAAPSWLGGTVSIDQSYIVVDGFALKQAITATGFSYNAMLKGSHNTLRNNVFQNPRTDLDAQWKLDGQHEEAVYLDGAGHLIENNLIERFYIGISVNGTLHTIRGNTIRASLLDAIRLYSDTGKIMGILIENNTLNGSWASDGVQTNGKSDTLQQNGGSQYPTTCGIVVRNNVIYDNAENGVDLKGSCHIVVEGNTIYGARGDNDGCYPLLGQGICDRGAGGAVMHGSHADSEFVIVRRNIVYDNNNGLSVADAHWVVYNNTVVNNNRDFAGPNSSYTVNYDSPPFKGLNLWSSPGAAKNNLVGDHNSVEAALRGNPRSKTELDGNLYFNRFQTPLLQGAVTPHWQGMNFAQWQTALSGYGNVIGKDLHSAVVASPGFISAPAQPLMSQAATLNFGLNASSPAINKGVALTTAAGAGSGNKLKVDNPDYFYDGFGITEGDAIVVGSAQARIKAVDYTAGVLTLDRNISWADKTPVNLPYAGTAPDVGALEYNSSQPSDSGVKLQPVSVTASASRKTEENPAATLDGSFDTYWAATGAGQYIQYDLGSAKVLNHVNLAFLLGDMAPYGNRQYAFDIQVSTNGSTFTTVGGRRTSTGATSNFETYSVVGTTARYVRITMYGSNVNTVNTLTEVELY